MGTRIGKGILAGFIATIALSALMIIKTAMGMMPHLNAIKMLSTMAHGFIGTPAVPLVGWVLHFMIGSLAWGILFALLYDHIPLRSSTGKGLAFATAAWLLMMVMVMPMAGAGIFGLHLGVGAPVATLILHWVFGAVMGAAYGKLAASHPAATYTHA
jgi:uncharacterized membrane protein YagU involved in acid resistance